MVTRLLCLRYIQDVAVLLKVWVWCGVVGAVMQGVWLVVTMPYAPSMRGLVAFLQLAWGLHFIVVVRTYYTMVRKK